MSIQSSEVLDRTDDGFAVVNPPAKTTEAAHSQSAVLGWSAGGCDGWVNGWVNDWCAGWCDGKHATHLDSQIQEILENNAEVTRSLRST